MTVSASLYDLRNTSEEMYSINRMYVFKIQTNYFTIFITFLPFNILSNSYKNVYIYISHLECIRKLYLLFYTDFILKISF